LQQSVGREEKREPMVVLLCSIPPHSPTCISLHLPSYASIALLLLQVGNTPAHASPTIEPDQFANADD